MLIEDIKEKLSKSDISYERLARMTGVNEQEIRDLLEGGAGCTDYMLLLKISDVLDMPMKVREAAEPYNCDGKLSAKYPRQGTYTIEDYEALPEDQRAELIDGVFYDMGAPRVLHQILVGEIHRQIANALIASGKPCIALVAPTDVQLDEDEWTMVQPDIMIVCKNDRVTYKGIYGSPDFVIEIISPWTRKKDYTIKPHKYQAAGVREYWILDPYQEKLLIYDFEESDIPRICGLDKDVPIGISEGEIVIRMEPVRRWIRDERMKEG